LAYKPFGIAALGHLQVILDVHLDEAAIGHKAVVGAQAGNDDARHMVPVVRVPVDVIQAPGVEGVVEPG